MRRNLLLLVWALFFASQGVIAQSDIPHEIITVGYCPEDFGDKSAGYYRTDPQVRTMSIAMELKNKDINGDKIYALRTFFYSSIADITLFISTDLSKEPVYTQKVGKAHGPMLGRTIILDTPYTLTGEKTYIGYTQNIGEECSEMSYQNVFPLWKESAATYNPKADLISVNGGEWTNLADYTRNEYVGSWCLWAYVSGGKYSDEIKNDLNFLIIEDKEYVKKGEPFVTQVYILNEGGQVIRNLELTYKNDRMTEAESVSYTELGVFKGGEYLLDLPEQVFNSVGEYRTEIEITKVNGQPVASSDKTHIFYSYECLDNFFTAPALIEEFTSQDSEIGVEVSRTLAARAETLENGYSWVTHHAGYGADSFTMDESKELVSFFGSNKIILPCMLDRSYFSVLQGVRLTPSFDPRDEQEIISDKKLPAFISVDLSGGYNSDTRELNLTVSGEFLKEYPQAKLAVFLTEDGLVAPQKNGGEDYVHNHVLRAVLSNTFGDEIELSDGKYAKNYTYIIPKKIKDFSCDPRNMKAIAFVADYNQSNMRSNVHNVTEISLNTIGSVRTASADNFHIYSDKEIVYIDGVYDKATIYTPDGCLIKQVQDTSSFNLKEGVYILKLIKNGQNVIRKIIVDK